MNDLIDSRYRDEFEHSLDPLVVVDCEDARIVHFNPQALMFLRYPAESLVKRPWNAIREFLKTADSENASEDIPEGFHLVCVQCGDGSQPEVPIRSERIRFFDRDCELLTLRLADEAVIPAMVPEPELPSDAERVRFESLQADARWQLLAAEVPGLIYQTSGPTDRFEMTVPYINDRVEEYLGWTPAEIYESPLRLLQGVHPEDWSRYCDTALAAMTTLSPFVIELRFVSRKTGVVRWFKVCSSPRVLDNGHQLWSGLALDIDDLRRSQDSLQQLSHNLEARVEERSRELLEAQSKLIDLQTILHRTSRFNLIRQIAAGWADQVHQPLAAIVNYAGVGLRTAEPASPRARQTTEIFQEIQDQALRAGELLRQIRKFVSEQSIEPTTHDLSAIVNSALALAKVVFQQNEIEYDVSLPEAEAWVRVDESHLIQVIVDLLINSVEAMTDAQVENPRIGIQIQTTDDHIELIFYDDGPGISKLDASRIFDEFYTTKENSLGLGLAMSRAVVESYGGTLDLVPSTTGAVFQMKLKRVPAES